MRHDVYEIICSTDTPLLIAKSKKDEVKVAAYHDTKNGALVLSNAIKNVFSPISGSSLQREGSDFEILSKDDVADLKEVAHCKCGATLLTTAELAESLTKHDLHCVVCGQKIEQEDEDLDDEEDLDLDVEEVEESCDDKPSEEAPESEEASADDDEDEEIEDIEIEDEEESEEDASTEEDEAEEEAPEEEVEESCDEKEDAKPEEKEEAASDEVDVEDDANSEEVDEEAEIEEEAPETEEACDEADDAKPQEEETDEGVELEVEEDEESDDKEEACIKFNCLSAVDKIHNVELVKCENGYRVLVNGNPVASAYKNCASSGLVNLFEDVASLTKALSAAVSEEGFSDEVKASFGIKPLMVKVSADEAAKQKLNAIEASVKKTYDEKQKEFLNRFEQSMSIASVGVNKGLYGSNLLTQSLIKSLAASGQEDAEDVVNEIMAKYGEAYLKQIIDKANELVSKSDDVRNETASIVKAASFSKTKAVNLAHTAVEAKVEEKTPVETTASTNRYSNLF